MSVLGVTGPSGSGKSQFSRRLAALGCGIVDCDRLARSVTKKGSEGLQALVDEFGAGILCSDGRLNRKKLAQVAFSDPQKTLRLNELTHPRIVKMVDERIAYHQKRGRIAVIDAPLLFGGGLDDRCDRIVIITAPEEQRVARLMRRNRCSEERVRTRLKAYREPLSHPKAVTFVNDGDLERLNAFADEIYQQILNKE